MQVPEPSIIDLDLKLLSGTEIVYSDEVVYSESHENVPVTDAYYKPMYWPLLLKKNKNYTAILKVHSHSPDITTALQIGFQGRRESRDP